MTTLAAFIAPEDVTDFVAALTDWPNSEMAYDEFSLAVSPFTTLYFHYDPSRHLDASRELVGICEEFEALLGKPFRIATHPDSERPHPFGSSRLPDLREFSAKRPLTKNFLFKVTDQTNHLSSPSAAGYFWRSSTWDGQNNNAYSYAQFYFPWKWWLEHQVQWREFVLGAADRLSADQAYSGLAMANALEIGARYEVSAWERALATHFHGLDIDFPFSMATDLQEGIRPPTWGFLLSNRWREKLGLSRDQVRAALADPQIDIADRDCGQWIEMGVQPKLYPVAEGVPPLPARVNRLLRPIRLQNLGLVGFGQWDGDPNERFSHVDSQRWLARFDDDSDWPSAEARLPAPHVDPSVRPVATPGGQPCPRAGWWFTPAQAGSRRQFVQGQEMPSVGGSYGVTIWQWDTGQ
jgi:Protein of unknown function (DUF3396)